MAACVCVCVCRRWTSSSAKPRTSARALFSSFSDIARHLASAILQHTAQN